jgi:hypothetical protein
MILFKYNALQILGESFFGDFHRFGCWQNSNFSKTLGSLTTRPRNLRVGG